MSDASRTLFTNLAIIVPVHQLLYETPLPRSVSDALAEEVEDDPERNDGSRDACH